MGHKAESRCVRLCIKPINFKDKPVSNMSTLDFIEKLVEFSMNPMNDVDIIV